MPFYIEATTLSVILVTLHSRNWTGLDWTDCKRLNSVVAYVACMKININTPEWQQRVRIWGPNGSAHVSALHAPDGSPHFSDDAVQNLAIKRRG